MTSSWCFLSTLNYDARSTTHQVCMYWNMCGGLNIKRLKIIWSGCILIIYTIGFNIPPHIFQYIQTYVFDIHITLSVSIWDSTIHWNINSSWIYFLRGPEDDPIKVETCLPDSIIFLLYIKFCVIFFNLIYYTASIYKVYKDKLQNCSCNQFHYIGTYKQVEKNSMTKNRGGNNGGEKWIEKTLRLLIV